MKISPYVGCKNYSFEFTEYICKTNNNNNKKNESKHNSRKSKYIFYQKVK